MLRIILLGLLIPIFSLIGKLLSKKYEYNRVFFEDFLTFLSTTKSEVDFSQKSIIEILDNFKNKKTDFYNFANNALFFSSAEKPYYISQNDYIFVLNFFTNFGKVDKYTQKEEIDYIILKITAIYDNAKKLEKTNKNLYFKLGFFFGLFIFILLI